MSHTDDWIVHLDYKQNLTGDDILQLLKTKQIESVSVDYGGISIFFKENIYLKIQNLDPFGLPHPLQTFTSIKVFD